MSLVPDYMTAATAFREGYTLEEIERSVRRYVVQQAVNESKGKMGVAAKRLGVHRNTMTRLVDELQVVVRNRKTKGAV